MLAEGVVVLGGASANDIEVTPDALRMPVSGHQEIASYKAGTILVADRARTGSANPRGFLRKILRIDEQDGFYQLATEQAPLAEVIRRGQVELSLRTSEATPFTPAGSQTRSLGPGLAPQGARDSFGFDDVTILKQSGSHALQGAPAVQYEIVATVVEGTADVDSTIDITASIEPNKIRSVQIVSSDSLAVDWKITTALVFQEPVSSAQLSALLEDAIRKSATFRSEVQNFSFGTYQAGSLPIPASGRSYADIDCELAFSNETEVTLGASATGQMSAGFRYEDGEFHPLWDHAESLAAVTPDGSIFGDVTARCTLRPVLEVLLWDVLVATMSTDAYAVFHADAGCESGASTGQVGGESYAGLAAIVRAETALFGLPAVEPTCPLFDVESSRDDVTGPWTAGVGLACHQGEGPQPSTAFEGPSASCFAAPEPSCTPPTAPCPSKWTCDPHRWGDCVCDCECGTDDVDCAVGECAGCNHDVCTIGDPLGLHCTQDGQSGACIRAVCENDPYCCTHAWTLSCIDHVEKGHFGCTPRNCQLEIPEDCAPGLCGGACGPCPSGQPCVAGVCRTGGPSFLWGLGEPVAINAVDPAHGWDLNDQLNHLLSVGPRIVRMWMGVSYYMSDSTSIDPTAAAPFDQAIERIQASGAVVVAMDHSFPPWMTGEADWGKIPCRDTAPGSAYEAFLDRFEETWRTLAQHFGSIRHWEPGNETNHDPFLSPGPCSASGAFTFEQKAAITTDLMFRSHRAIRSVQPNATIFLPAPAPVDPTNTQVTITGIAAFIERLYANILSNEWPSNNPRDYFNAVAWHPYLWGEPTEQNWVAPNQMIHQVLVDHGDGDLPVLFSEYGNTDLGDASAYPQHANRMYASVRLAEKHFPWLWGWTWFRLLDDPPAATWGGPSETGYGILRDPAGGYAWKQSAYTFDSFAHNAPAPNDVVAAYEWDSPGNKDGFTFVGVPDSASVGGLVYGAADGLPMMYSPAVDIPTAGITYVEVRSIVAAGDTGRFYFITDGDGDWNEAKGVWFEVVADNRPHVYTISLSSLPTWTGRVVGFRIDPTDAVTTFAVDSVRFR